MIVVGNALHWALELHRAPGMRLALRERALPQGVDEVLAIAAGSPTAVARAAEASGQSDARLLEAARFYLQEILFFPKADAYRLLGVAADAGADQIKRHHRLLQQWLHPDRRQGDWESVFAGRVNCAWDRLRSESRRQAYDSELAAEESAGTGSHAEARLRLRGLETPPPLAERWRG
ncbi:MAG TPA: DnaJ domain-containing protein, partial [Xanthomonadaceae bacterium]|nr:DnaJ domain-containing protein [Xanthomonadaceae bacterium]